MLKYAEKFIVYVFVALLLMPVTVSAERAVDLNLVVQMKGRGGFEFPPPRVRKTYNAERVEASELLVF